MKQPQSFIFIGRSGSGKGTQAELLVEYLKKQDPSHSVLYVETGAEFREFMKDDQSYTQALAKKTADKGTLAPEFLAIYLWAHRMVTGMTENQHFIIDGTPRKYDEALVLDSVFDFYGLSRPHVFYINVSESWARSRLASRGRADDGKEEIDSRFHWFDTNVMPAIDFYKKDTRYTFHEIDGERPISEIHSDIRNLVTL